MIYLRVRQRIVANAGETLKLRDVAGFLADARCRLNEMRVILPKGAGVWQVDALQLTMQIIEQNPEESVSVLGNGIGWLHRETMKAGAGKRGGYSLSRMVVLVFGFSVFCALLVLLLSAGNGQNHPYWIVLPYAMSMLLGAAVYLARVGPQMAQRLRCRVRGHPVRPAMANAARTNERRAGKMMDKRGKK